MKEITIKLWLSEQQEEALGELLPFWQQWESPEGEKPFVNKSIEELFQTLMEIGSLHTIWKQFKEDQWRQGLITTDELLDNQQMTVAERIEARKAKEGGAQ